MFLESLGTARFIGVLRDGSYRPGKRALVFHKVGFSFSCRKLRHLLVLIPSITSLPGAVTSHWTTDLFCTESILIFCTTLNKKNKCCIWTCTLMHATMHLMSLVIPDLQVVPPASSYLRAFSPFLCSLAAPPPLAPHRVLTILCHLSSLSLYSFTGFFSPLACKKVSLTWTFATRKTYARSLLWRISLVLHKNQKESVSVFEGQGDVETLKVLRQFDSEVLTRTFTSV